MPNKMPGKTTEKQTAQAALLDPVDPDLVAAELSRAKRLADVGK